MSSNSRSSALELAGRRLWVEESGSGDAVLLLSGLGYASWCWRDVTAELSARARAIAVDNRGTGRSDKPAGPYSIAMLADDAVEVLDALGVNEAHVVGHSMGGYIALTLALRHPARVHSLVLIATGAGGPTALPVPEQTLKSWHASSHLPPAEYARKTMPLSYAPGWAEANRDRFETHLKARLEFPTPPECWAAQFDACERYLEEGIDAAGIRAPALVVHGTEDRVVPFANGESLAAALAGSRLVAVKGAGHLCFLERPLALSRIMVDAVDRFQENAS